MEIYPIPEYLQDSHDGDEWALAAILNDRVVALDYLADLSPELMEFLNTPAWQFIVHRWARNSTPELRQLQGLGRVAAGVVTAAGFELHFPLTY